MLIIQRAGKETRAFDIQNDISGVSLVTDRPRCLRFTIRDWRRLELVFETEMNRKAVYHALCEVVHRTSPTSVRICVATWNLGNAEPTGDMRTWLRPNGEGADIYVVGVQEGSYGGGALSNAARTIGGAAGDPAAAREQWFSLVHRAASGVDVSSGQGSDQAAGGGGAGGKPRRKRSIDKGTIMPQRKRSLDKVQAASAESSKKASMGESSQAADPSMSSLAGVSGAAVGGVRVEGEPLHRVGAVSLGQIHMLVLCREELREFVTAVETVTEAMGVGGVGSNKGATALAMHVCSHSLCFVNCHLAAHDEYVNKRNANLSEMERDIKLGLAQAHGALDLSQRFMHTFVAGDLNYRIDLPRDEVVRLIRRGEWPTLRRSDQLAQAMGSGEAAAGFREGAIGFAPTFKHVPGVGPTVAPLAQPLEALASEGMLHEGSMSQPAPLSEVSKPPVLSRELSRNPQRASFPVVGAEFSAASTGPKPALRKVRSLEDGTEGAQAPGATPRGGVATEKYLELKQKREKEREEDAHPKYESCGIGHRPYELKKMRVPSWCDRVLWSSLPGAASKIEQLDYVSAPTLASSDHTPVSALFKLDVSVPRMERGLLLGSCTLVLSRLSASGLKPADSNGLADPYLQVYPEFGHDEDRAAAHSTIKHKTLSPSWDGEELRIKVPHFRCWRESIESSHLFLVLSDYDRIGKNEPMGGAVLDCGSLFDAVAPPRKGGLGSRAMDRASRAAGLNAGGSPLSPPRRLSLGIKTGRGMQTGRGEERKSMMGGLGQSIKNLGGGFGAASEPRPVMRTGGRNFSIPLRRFGQPVGVLKGNLRVEIAREPSTFVKETKAFVQHVAHDLHLDNLHAPHLHAPHLHMPHFPHRPKVGLSEAASTEGGQPSELEPDPLDKPADNPMAV